MKSLFGKKACGMLVVFIIIVAMLCMPASAITNNYDYFSFTVRNTDYNAYSLSPQVKQNATPLYLLITDMDTTYIRTQAWGGRSANGAYNNLTCNSSGNYTPYITCQADVVNHISSSIYENNFTYAKLAFQSATETSTYVSGVWSANS